MSVTSRPLPKPGTRMTFEEFKALNLPESSSLYLVKGVVCDEADSGREEEVTKRNWRHARVESRVSYLLHVWREASGFACGIFSGEVGCEEPRHGLDVGIDVAVFADDLLDKQEDSPFVIGVPLLAVEILSPTDRQGAVSIKVEGYLDAGTPLVWVIDPRSQSVVVRQPGKPPRMFTEDMSVSGGKTLPGFEIAAAEFFK